MKYVVITIHMKPERDADGTMHPYAVRYPFVFPNFMVHSHVAQAMCLLLDMMNPGAVKVEATSAGELNSADFEGELFGKSTTLGLSADPSDAMLLRICDYGGAYSVPARNPNTGDAA